MCEPQREISESLRISSAVVAVSWFCERPQQCLEGNNNKNNDNDNNSNIIIDISIICIHSYYH